MEHFKISSRWKIVLVATLFNLLWEYSMRSINDFLVHPKLPLFLFLTYFPYLAMVEDLIGRHRLKDYHVMVVALFFGLAWQLIGPSVVFLPPLTIGINWSGLLFVNLIWWCPIQTVMAFYIANRITPREDWGHPLLSKAGWGLALFIFILITLLFRLNVPNFPPITLQQVVIMIGLMIATALVFRKTLSSLEEGSSSTTLFEKSRVMDYLSAFTTIFFFFSAVFLTSNPSLVYVTHLSRTALRAVMAGSTTIVLSMLAHRLSSRKPIPV